MDTIRQKLLIKWNNRKEVAKQFQGKIQPHIMQKLRENSYNLDIEVITASPEGVADVCAKGGTGFRFVVSLPDRTCSCRASQGSGIPCKHAIAVEDSPRGPLKQTGESPLKTHKQAKAERAPLKHTGHGPCRGGPDGSPRRPTQRSPRTGSASLEGARLPRAGAAPFEGVRLPRVGSASLEGLLRPRAGSASLEGAPHAHGCSRTRAFNTLTTAGRRHHAPGARAPVPTHQLPRREPIPATAGDCAAWPVPVP
jgi:hypothetical protein